MNTAIIGLDARKTDKLVSDLNGLAVKLVMTSLKELLILERALLHASDDANDDRTNAITSDFISEQEKTVWMLNSCLN